MIVYVAIIVSVSTLIVSFAIYGRLYKIGDQINYLYQEIDEIKKDTNIILNDIVATNRYLIHLQEQPR